MESGDASPHSKDGRIFELSDRNAIEWVEPETHNAKNQTEAAGQFFCGSDTME
jgi:hypothetical protein